MKYVENFNGRSNNLNLLKFIAAIAVIFSHAYSIVNVQMRDPLSRLTRGQLSFGGLSVAIFFFASGFYVTKSLCNKRRAGVYWKSRLVKIYPSFITVMILTVFLMGPLVSTLSIAEYFSSIETYSYLLYLVLLPRYRLPGVFIGNKTSIVNGSLWTLILEIICYICLFVVYKLKLLEKGKLRTVNFLLAICIIIAFGIQPDSIFAYHNYLRPLFVFIMGMEYYIFRDKIVMSIKYALLLFGIGILLCVFNRIDLFMVCIFPYLLSVVIFADKQVGEKIGRLGNYSYGIYLTAFPIQQLLVQYCPEIGIIGDTMITILFSFILGLIIYRFIEVPCSKLALKTKHPVNIV